MDTNLLVIIERLLTAAKGTAPVNNGQTGVLIAGMIVNAFLAGLAAVLSYLSNRDVSAVKETAIKSAAVVEKSAAAVEKIEVHTNSERTATLELIEKQRESLLELSKELATFKEQKRGQDMAKEVASGIIQANK